MDKPQPGPGHTCAPSLSKHRRLQLELFITKQEAREVIQLFNTFRRDKVKKAFDLLFLKFIWRFGRTKVGQAPLSFVEVVPHPTQGHTEKSFHRGSDSKLDSVRTAATDGFTLWINKKNIMNRAYDKKNTHFGILPSNISHFSAVMLHEFGHILRKRSNKSSVITLFRKSPELRKCYNNFQQDIARARSSGLKKKRLALSDKLEEWIADIFSKSFILYATERRV